MNGKQISRKTAVVSLSLDPTILAKLDSLRKKTGQTRSSFFSTLVEKYDWDEQWTYLRKIGEKTAKRFKITSEEDVYRMMGDA